MGKHEDELNRIAAAGEWDVPHLLSLQVSLGTFRRALATLAESDSWQGNAATGAAVSLTTLATQMGNIQDALGTVAEHIESANAARSRAIGAAADLPSADVDPFWENLAKAGTAVVHPVLGPLAADSAIDAIEGWLGGQREEAAEAALKAMAVETSWNAVAISAQRAQIEANTPTDDKFKVWDYRLPEPVEDSTPPTPDPGWNTPPTPGGTGGSGPRYTGPSVDGSLVGTSPGGSYLGGPLTGGPLTGTPGLQPGPGTGQLPVGPVGPGTPTLPGGPGGPGGTLPPGTLPGGGGLAGGLGGGAAGAAALAAAKAAGGGIGGMRLGGAGGVGGAGGLGGVGGAGSAGGSGAGARGASGLLGRAGGLEGGSAATGAGGANGAGGNAAAGGRGGTGMMGGQGGGAGSSERERRSGLGGPIAPKLDDDEMGPRSRGAGAGGRGK